MEKSQEENQRSDPSFRTDHQPGKRVSGPVRTNSPAERSLREIKRRRSLGYSCAPGDRMLARCNKIWLKVPLKWYLNWMYFILTHWTILQHWHSVMEIWLYETNLSFYYEFRFKDWTSGLKCVCTWMDNGQSHTFSRNEYVGPLVPS